jgi:hypothetical protein
MARRLPRQPLTWLGLALVLAGASPDSGKPSPVLVSYNFDDALADTGPDTFSVFRNARGNVQLSTEFQVSGHRSVEIRDVAGDKDFPELQGYLPERRDGWLVMHFALLVVDPKEELNVAFAGPGWFRLGKDGMAFWLTTRDGWLFHTTDSIPKRLLRLEPYTWYAVDVDYDVARGRYDLRITPEGADRPAVSLADQPNASSQAGSAVSLFSFTGSVLTDDSNVLYYVDDLWIGTSREAVLPPFVAPGRRKLFVDLLNPGASSASSLERAGDAAFAAADYSGAKSFYEQALATAENPVRLYLKLSDVHHLLGNREAEKAYREKVYGSLDPRQGG